MALSKIQTGLLADGSVDNTALAADAVTAQKIAGTVNLGRRNLILNGAMNIFQRGSLANTNYNNSYGLDRWAHYCDHSTARYAVTQESDAPSGTGLEKSLKVNTTATGTFSGSQTATIHQRIEGYACQALWGGLSAGIRSSTLTFWYKTNHIQTYSVTMRIGSASYSYPVDFTPTATNTWTKVTVNFPASANGTIYKTNTEEISLLWALENSYNPLTPNTWTSGNTHGSSNVGTTFFDATGNNFYLTGCQLEAGDNATSFEHLSYGEELALCKRYYRYYPESHYLGARTAYVNGGANDTGPAYSSQMHHEIEMRTTPSVSFNTGGVAVSGNQSRGFRIAFANSYAAGTTATQITDVTLSAEL